MKRCIESVFVLPGLILALGMLTRNVIAQTPPSTLVGTLGMTENVTPIGDYWSGSGSIPSTPIVLHSEGGTGPIIYYYGGPTNSTAGQYSGNYSDIHDGIADREEGGYLGDVDLQLNLTNQTAYLSFSHSINWTNAPGWSGSYDITVGPLACAISTNFGVLTVSLNSETNYPEGYLFGYATSIFTTYGQVAGTNTVLGIDVSSDQGAIYWPAVKTAGTTFAYVRATLGADTQYGGTGVFLDTKLNYNVQTAINNQILVGVYHVAYPSSNPPLNEALTFLDEAENYVGDGYLSPMLDLETPMADAYVAANGGGASGKAALSLWVSNWMQYVSNATGVTPGIYTSQSVLANDLNSSLAGLYPLWIATQSGNPTSTPSYSGTSWSNWILQQWKIGICPGISGSVDFDSFNGNLTSIFAFTSHPSAITSLRTMAGPGGSSIQPPQNGQFQLGIFAPGQQQAVVQSSQDLINWADAATLSLVNGAATFVDASAGANNQSFYHVKR